MLHEFEKGRSVGVPNKACPESAGSLFFFGHLKRLALVLTAGALISIEEALQLSDVLAMPFINLGIGRFGNGRHAQGLPSDVDKFLGEWERKAEPAPKERQRGAHGTRNLNEHRVRENTENLCVSQKVNRDHIGARRESELDEALAAEHHLFVGAREEKLGDAARVQHEAISLRNVLCE